VEGWLDENLNGVKERNEVKGYLANSLDRLGVNYYTRFVIKGKRNLLAKLFAGIPAVPEIVPNYGFGCQPKSQSADGRPTSDMGWEIYPEGLLEALKAMSKFEKPLYRNSIRKPTVFNRGMNCRKELSVSSVIKF